MSEKVNRKATTEDKKRALDKIKNSNRLGVKGNLSPKEVKLVLEYVSQGGRLQRSTKTAAKQAESHARALLQKRAKVVDALHIFTPAVNTLQNEYVSQQKGSNIIAQMLLDHGYKDADFQKAAKKVDVAYKRGIKQEIKAYEAQYTNNHKSPKKPKKGKDSKVINLNSKKSKQTAKRIKKAKKSGK